ncbi:hypothetical protein HG535_0A03200 [Zygotorulaspora mrakii]|uniref:Zinc-ribbon 15 domain-containing protein n=1 Tax=Zygotorulaspora mrakii TaxID=42260 RepID=A0A7H9AVY1_ZYGMR|nr:uncharacterized protein HG535_0A03200 [Zygotorulaspora mrakii]QLG70381.1 hypothetical protein HG535_0A03200 [Zygotorulaspora mrakii]
MDICRRPFKGRNATTQRLLLASEHPSTVACKMSFVCIPIICGVKQWDTPYANDPKLNAIYCPNCHNRSVGPVKRKEFISIWFIPLFPIYWGKQLRCPICNWRQDFKNKAQLEKVLREQQNIA